MGRKILATIIVLLAVSAAGAYLLYTQAHVTLSIIDPPPERYDSSIQAIYVAFTKVEIRGAAAGNDSGWHTLLSSGTVDLLTILDVSKVLGDAQLPPGKYTEIRFFASQATITINGTDVAYTIPSGNQTGIKVQIANGGFRIFGGQSLGLLLDLSFRNSEIMNSPSKILAPVASARVV